MRIRVYLILIYFYQIKNTYIFSYVPKDCKHLNKSKNGEGDGVISNQLKYCKKNNHILFSFTGSSFLCWYTQRNFFEILLNQTEIRLYLPFSG